MDTSQSQRKSVAARIQRISIVGTTGSGKSTLARAVSEKLGFPCVELDAIHWLPNWTPIPETEFKTLVAEILKQDDWVIEGGYAAVRQMILGRADTVVWLDYPFSIVFWRLLRRTTRRALRKETLWNGNRESILLSLSKESIILWLFKSYRRNKKKFADLFELEENRHLNVLHFQTPEQTDKWLEGLC